LGFIRTFVREVKVTGDEVLLTYTPPLPPEHIPGETAVKLYLLYGMVGLG
jgi:hypothetical protein